MVILHPSWDPGQDKPRTRLHSPSTGPRSYDGVFGARRCRTLPKCAPEWSEQTTHIEGVLPAAGGQCEWPHRTGWVGIERGVVSLWPSEYWPGVPGRPADRAERDPLLAQFDPPASLSMPGRDIRVLHKKQAAKLAHPAPAPGTSPREDPSSPREDPPLRNTRCDQRFTDPKSLVGSPFRPTLYRQPSRCWQVF